MILLIISVTIALLVSFLCSLMEACLLSLSQTDIARFSENKPSIAAIWKKFKSNIQTPIAVILVINTLAHTIGAAISGAQFNKLFGSKWIALFSLIFSLIMIQWTEILPKTLGVRYNRPLAIIAAVPLKMLIIAFKPILVAIELINRPFEGKRRQHIESAASDITVLARSAVVENQISREQERLIARSIQMSGLTARDVMVDRNDIQTLATTMTLSEGLIAAHLQRHTRFPLAEGGDIDRINGYVNFKDIVGALHMNPSDPSLKGIQRPVLFVPATMRLPDLLRKFTRGYQHMAIVQDEQQTTVGLITLEDLIETLVGELEDEYDVPPDLIVQLSVNRFRVGGGVTLRQLKERLFPELIADQDVTLNTWMKSQAGTAPVKESFTVHHGNLSFRVRRITRGNIYDIIVERNPAAAA
jgi:putative hemolysin